MSDVTINEPERAVFVSDRARRRRVLRLAGLTCTAVVALWVTAVVLGALGDPLPGLSVVTLKPSATPPPPAPARPDRPHPELAAVAVAAPAPSAARPISTTAPAATTPVSYTPPQQRAAPTRPRKRHAAARQHRGSTRTRSNGGVRPGRQLTARHQIRRPHRQRRVSV